MTICPPPLNEDSKLSGHGEAPDWNDPNWMDSEKPDFGKEAQAFSKELGQNPDWNDPNWADGSAADAFLDKIRSQETPSKLSGHDEAPDWNDPNWADNRQSDIKIQGNVLADSMSALLQDMKQLQGALPDILKNTVTVSVIESIIPEGGINIAQIVRSQMEQNGAIEIKDLSDNDIIAKLQDGLESEGLEGLSANIFDGNLSREDAIRGLAEYGHIVGGNVSDELLNQVQDAVTGVGASDPFLLKGLALAEQQFDNIFIDIVSKVDLDQYNSAADEYCADNPDDSCSVSIESSPVEVIGPFNSVAPETTVEPDVQNAPAAGEDNLKIDTPPPSAPNLGSLG